MVYAFSRDGAMPLSSLWHKVNKQEVPVNAVWLSVLISFCMALPVRIYHQNSFLVICKFKHSHTSMLQNGKLLFICYMLRQNELIKICSINFSPVLS
jgi:L-asparagine transporter-like permease